ncbi:triphosphoribosyl-dephospho-CoA synthase CitG [Inediibacterium massiliense]|uniref:triphosphoribosyl-dephospho-CoA synthase CitG n=1 Tax=Inediibacterium massiliense TaxID=1658111 RepID=UPI000B008360|nr:triphosphoribosyl-dephospho-CoA synthase CitG [Inediibacterium massiliense]
MQKDFEICQYISEMALKAMLFEVSATPKPGLVDRNNSGAHKDMDFYSFMASSASLAHTFHECAYEGFTFEEDDLKKLLNKIRPIGIKGENKMFCATNKVNTHKGLIFSLGIICAASAYKYKEVKSLSMNVEEICRIIQKMSQGISQQELGDVQKKEKLTYGENLFKKYGIKGIRGEVESGFLTVRKYSLPICKKLMRENKNMNDVLVQVLLHLMSVTEDSNILGRHDVNTLKDVQRMAKEVLNLGGISTKEGRQRIFHMDSEFISKHISPGGSADLLAVTMMLYFLENINS